MRGGLSGRVYAVLRYRDLGDGTYEALEKYDVTDDFLGIAMARAAEEGPPSVVDAVLANRAQAEELHTAWLAEPEAEHG
jgi:hypothetical protein